jgi:S-adenosylmethionine:tRNA ribosyltransferase-isomerase
LQYHARVQIRDFDYDLPADLIAQSPLAERSASRLLIVKPGGTEARGDATDASAARSAATASAATEGEHGAGSPDIDFRAGTRDDNLAFRDAKMSDFPKLLRDNDLLVFNDTKVVAARVIGSKPSGGQVEIFLERVVAAREATVQLRASKPIREGLEINTQGGVVIVRGRDGDLWRVELPAPAWEFFEQWGSVPLPPYIHRAPDQTDRERYQSIFARERGAVAAPTASLHFDESLVAEIEARGIQRAFVTLHVGAGTFQPVRVENLDDHVMHAERVSVSGETVTAINNARARGGRIIAIGTTVVRALESAALETAAASSRARESSALGSAPAIGLPPTGWTGDTRLFIRPGFQFNLTDALLTNFHLPQSTLLMLVCAFAGADRVLRAYKHAVRERYRFFSYGDAMFLTRAGS